MQEGRGKAAAGTAVRLFKERTEKLEPSACGVHAEGGQYGQAKERFMVDALELQGDEGRDKLRKAAGRSTYPVIRGLPNGVTRVPEGTHRTAE